MGHEWGQKKGVKRRLGNWEILNVPMCSCLGSCCRSLFVHIWSVTNSDKSQRENCQSKNRWNCFHNYLSEVELKLRLRSFSWKVLETNFTTRQLRRKTVLMYPPRLITINQVVVVGWSELFSLNRSENTKPDEGKTWENCRFSYSPEQCNLIMFYAHFTKLRFGGQIIVRTKKSAESFARDHKSFRKVPAKHFLFPPLTSSFPSAESSNWRRVCNRKLVFSALSTRLTLSPSLNSNHLAARARNGWRSVIAVSLQEFYCSSSVPFSCSSFIHPLTSFLLKFLIRQKRSLKENEFNSAWRNPWSDCSRG